MPQDLFDLVEFFLSADQGWGELNHGITSVVGPAVQAGVEEGIFYGIELVKDKNTRET